jgi:hypothetical protein
VSSGAGSWSSARRTLAATALGAPSGPASDEHRNASPFARACDAPENLGACLAAIRALGVGPPTRRPAKVHPGTGEVHSDLPRDSPGLRRTSLPRRGARNRSRASAGRHRSGSCTGHVARHLARHLADEVPQRL